jgi:putative flavoprotein involved in K+ transport
MANSRTTEVTTWLARLEATIPQGTAAALFAPDAYWRDFLALTWTLVTVEGRPAITKLLADTIPHAGPLRLSIDGEATETPEGLAAWFTYETAQSRGRGHLRLKGGQGHTFFMAMRELVGFEEKSGPTREAGVEHGARRGRITWADQRALDAAAAADPYCLIVGGGQGGIALAARMRRLGVPTLVIDTNPRPGDSWRRRYKSLCLHDAVWYDHMPYLPFPAHWPIYTPKDKMGDWLEMYTRLMEIEYWGSTTCRAASYAGGRWTVTVEREGREITLNPTHLVLATGMSGVPNMPRIRGAETFRGTLRHSSAHPGIEGFAGKHAVVVGANNSAHDIATDLWEHEAAGITMIQRSSTLVARQETLRRNAAGGVYSEEAAQAGISTDTADLTVASTPYGLLPAQQIPIWKRVQQQDRDFYASLDRVGFKLDFGEDGSGLSLKYLRRGSGYYIDVGGSALVADGRIGLASGVEVAELTEHTAILTDGRVLPADLIVFATGYGSMTGWAAQLISQEVADRVGPCWGLGSGTTYDPGPWQGELRNMWKPTKQPNLWFHGGNLAQSRHYSQYIALQIKARLEGLPTPVWPG